MANRREPCADWCSTCATTQADCSIRRPKWPALFLDAGDLLVTTRGRDGKELERWVVESPGAYRQLPLVVLVNHDSASAAEIVAAALADHHRATSSASEPMARERCKA